MCGRMPYSQVVAHLAGPTACKGGDDPPWAAYENEDCQRGPQGKYAPGHEVLDNRRAAVKRELEGRSIAE